jgi:predicted RNase H-like nuclease (RuvC/YqgF family)
MVNRTLCDVLKEMRTCYETRNFSYLKSLIEECQTLGNRMEAALWNQKDFRRAEQKYRKLKREIKEMEESLEEQSVN